jgi:hypothetical protein
MMKKKKGKKKKKIGGVRNGLAQPIRQPMCPSPSWRGFI